MSDGWKVAIFWSLVIVAAIFGVTKVVTGIGEVSDEESRCVAAGGVWEDFYGSNSICFDKNAVIKL